MKLLTDVMTWVDDRFPATKMFEDHMSKYYAPKNFNFWYFFGSLALLVLVNQLLTGIWLAMMYTPTAEGAFDSVEYIMRDVDYGWLIRYMHSTGASAFFVVIYLHMFRALLYGSYQKPRELVWLFGMGIFVLLMGEAFLGYVLPWGNMSYWGFTVMTDNFLVSFAQSNRVFTANSKVYFRFADINIAGSKPLADGLGLSPCIEYIVYGGGKFTFDI